MSTEQQNAVMLPDWNIEELFGYEPKTTFYTDFSIAEQFGEEAIRDTFDRALLEWGRNTEYVTELVMVLNWKSFEHHDRGLLAEQRGDDLETNSQTDLCNLYIDLFEEADDWCMRNLKGDDLSYYIRTTD